MKAKVLLIGFLWLPLCCLLPAPQEKINDQSFPLDMAVNSVDDMYSTCAAQMEAKVKKTYFENEMEMKNNVFSKAWNATKHCMNKKIEDKDDALTKDHRRAICVYTAGGKLQFYKVFNEVVRTNKQQYSSSFPFHSLHFWLTRAIQILKTNHNECYTTFRRTGVTFTGKLKEIRFGIFASSSKLSNLTDFGKTTCFKITTCHGAYLKKYPVLGYKEQEVLIPPYEKFEITLTLINEDEPRELSDCETVYVLKSKGVQSNLDCQVANQIIL
ncbi:erythroblast NAD(P)(+)--arginine ADP-ribosyltransferase-like [Poecilia latipinna]|uniref:erythroblast NAD(P)(+)--arginine ADP-ribosyltransferase-like n=1 Tax=Poecilia latipinna TaxID=48699 RepID=UPI00072DA971|nr:PREDICTED: erythroblast NAD(P)(+)--arginine ADP-ribosyltransferase-like [Poecilia latipinna]XP_014911822.1 PREDICTED: erythroblast NAD(P)(+)--arginine ADP-ribosyltransferase-like [Poecilia latipinna]